MPSTMQTSSRIVTKASLRTSHSKALARSRHRTKAYAKHIRHRITAIDLWIKSNLNQRRAPLEINLDVPHTMARDELRIQVRPRAGYVGQPARAADVGQHVRAADLGQHVRADDVRERVFADDVGRRVHVPRPAEGAAIAPAPM